MTTITRELIAAYLNGEVKTLTNSEQKELARIALASLEAEPDYIRYDCGCCGWETIEEWRDNDVCPKCNHKPMGKTELFSAPPAPDNKQTDELVMWVKRLAHSLRKANPDSKLQNDAMDYLSRKGLISVEDVLR